MKTKQLKKQFIPRYCYIDDVHVFLIARTHEFPISLIALAAACAMNGLHCLCASVSMPGTAEIEAALGNGKVIRLSADALVPGSKVLRNLAQQARDENAVLLIDVEVGPAFEFQGLDKAMDLKRHEALTVVLSLAAHDVPSQVLNSSYWCCRPDHCIAHVIGAVDEDSCESDEFEMISMVPCGQIGGSLVRSVSA